ncbi:diguanylate cyclase [Ketobacter sp.]|uniref:sensor domain-containing diguanylate cyclase n=1 Tax=Ketobacter sp. TaxID=2083498 RepID=UPI000F2D28AC|nr:diguanylate cyclase [Ketobacter sp.]RLT96347.1 MAG: diguanylate cyclase [Ketobacter sp.]
MLLQRLLLTCLGLLLATVIQAGTITLTPDTGPIELMPRAELYVDESEALTVEAIRDVPLLQPVEQETLSLGFTKARVWLRFQLYNPEPTPAYRVLYMNYFLLDDVVLYREEGNGFSAQYSGRRYLSEHNQSPIPTRFFHFEITLPAHSSQTFYLALKSEDAISTAATLMPRADFQRVMVTDTIGITLFSGLILANLCFALFMLIKLRELEMLYYFGFLLSHHVFTITMLEGVPASLFNMESLFWNRTGIIFMVNFAVIMSVLFFRSFLKFQEKYPQLYRRSQALLVIAIISTLQCLLVPHVIGSAVSTVLCMIVGTGIMYSCVQCAIAGDRSAMLFLLSWSSGITGATIFCLKLWNVLPSNGFTDNAWQVGATLEAILFSITIADRVTAERRMRLQTQMELVKQERTLRLTQEQLLRTETAAKEELEQQVEERTQDITRILGELEIQNRKLMELSINDGLTKVRNRRFFNDAYPELWREAQSKGKWISVIMLDIDHFKSINDTYGHLTGDQCLVAVAEALRNRVTRPKDIICRYGGEEFVMVLFDTPAESAMLLAESIRTSLSETVLETDSGPLSVTASLGVAARIPNAAVSATDLLSTSDHALYESKSSGRNRVTFADHPQSASASTRR